MPCPFGYTAADDADGEDADVEVEDNDEEENEGDEGCQEHGNQAGANARPEGIKFDKGPVEWFKENAALLSEKDFAAKREALQQEARRRLEGLKLAKEKLLEFDSDMSVDGDFSDFASDAHSLSSFASHAEAWLDLNKYTPTAETYIRFAAPAALAIAMVSLYQSFTVMQLCSKVSGVVVNTQWPALCLSVSGLMTVFVALSYAATMFRSKRILLTSVIGLLAVYSAAAAMVALMHAKPTMLDERLFTAACNRLERSESVAAAGASVGGLTSSRLCTLMPTIRLDVDAAVPPLVSSVVSVGASALVLVALGVWYTYQLAFVEKRASKHKRRTRRSKHTIPWDKIKVTGIADWVATGAAPKA